MITISKSTAELLEGHLAESVALAVASGAHPKAIQVRMGHSTISVTLDRYGHLFPELDEAIVVAFDQGWTQARAAAGVA